MAAEFPTSLHDFSATYADNTAQATTHPTIHNELNEELAAVQTKIGVDSSAVVTSIDYLLKSTSSSDPGHKHTLATGATDVTASAAELNLNDTAVAGTAVASKTLALGAAKGVDGLGTINLDNTKALQIDDSGGTTRNVASVDASNNLTIGASTLNGLLMYPRSAISVYDASATQSISHNTNTVLQFDTEVFDVNSEFNTGTYRWTPKSEGYYFVCLMVRYDAAIDTTAQAIIRKNASAYVLTDFRVYAAYTTVTTSALIQMNGSTDYIEFVTYQYNTATTARSALGNDASTVGAFGFKVF